MKTITAQNFKTILNSTFTKISKLNDDIQELIMFALQHFVDHQDATLVATILNTATDGQRLKANDIKLIIKFIRAHSNVKIAVASDLKTYEATKSGKKGTKATMTKPANGIAWYNFDPTAQAISTFDLVQIASQLRKRFDSANEDPAKTVTNKEVSKKLLTRIDAILADLVTA